MAVADAQRFYSAAALNDVHCNFQPVKTRWLRRTIGYACTHCDKGAARPRVQPCPVGQRQDSSAAAGLAMRTLVDSVMEAGHKVPWSEIKIQDDYDISYMRGRVILTVNVEES